MDLRFFSCRSPLFVFVFLLFVVWRVAWRDVVVSCGVVYRLDFDHLSFVMFCLLI